jgi:hypothetical protein
METGRLLKSPTKSKDTQYAKQHIMFLRFTPTSDLKAQRTIARDVIVKARSSASKIEKAFAAKDRLSLRKDMFQK